MIGYTAKILDTFEYSPGAWKGLRIGIFLVSPEGEEQIGEYTRNYHQLYRTFHPLRKETMRDSTHSKVISPLLYYPFGFVAGCIWGDDSSWKIEYLDLSAVEKGEIRRDARFGYIEMPDGISLKQAIDLVDYGYDDSQPYPYGT